MRKLAIIGASEHQLPLIRRAKEKGLETHVFAWEAGDVGEAEADYFHPVSIVEVGAIAELCREIGVDGICTIGTDLGNITVHKVAYELGLPGNSLECLEATTNKEVMRRVLLSRGCPSPLSVPVRKGEEYKVLDLLGSSALGGATFSAPENENLSDNAASSPQKQTLTFPIIVKPTDRSGSRGITKLESAEGLEAALQAVYEVSFEPVALVEEFAEGREFSVETFSWKGEHVILALTEKFTTEAPHFIERGHLQPARLTEVQADIIKNAVMQSLDALGVEMGAGHAEIKLDDNNIPKIIEIASRMGGDCIGSDLTRLSSGMDFLGAVIDVALGREPDLVAHLEYQHEHAAVRFSFGQKDTEGLCAFAKCHPEMVVRDTLIPATDEEVTDSSGRFGCQIIAFNEELDEVDFGLW